jgi:hypothetical protein
VQQLSQIYTITNCYLPLSALGTSPPGGHIFNAAAIAAFASKAAISRCIQLLETSIHWANTPSDTTVPFCYAIVTANLTNGSEVGSLYWNLTPLLDQSANEDAASCCDANGKRATCHYQTPSMMQVCHQQAEATMAKEVHAEFIVEATRVLDEWGQVRAVDYGTLLNKPEKQCVAKCSAAREGGQQAVQIRTSAVAAGSVSCGGHDAASCVDCPQGHGAEWCNGDCGWADGECIDSNQDAATTKGIDVKEALIDCLSCCSA